MADENTGGNPPGQPPAPASAPHPDLTKPPAKEGDPPRGLWIMPEVWTQREQELERLKTWKAEREREAQIEAGERERAAAEKGGYEKALTEIRTTYDRKVEAANKRAETVESKWLAKERAGSINEALSGKEFTGDPALSARMLRQLLESEVEAVLGPDGEPQIRDRKTLRPVADYLKERLESPELGIFFKPSTRGGSGTDGTRSPANPQPPAASLTHEQAVKAWQTGHGTPGFGAQPVSH